MKSVAHKVGGLNRRKRTMLEDDYIEELLQKYELDELLDIFVQRGLTPREFCDRMIDYITQMGVDDVNR